MSLQNRVDPFGTLQAVSSRGTLMGNRGGRFHSDTRTLGARRWASKAWISCRCDFKGRHREVWGCSYTELFFLDDVTALAAGHRPCFECRREQAKAFQAAFCGMSAPDMDRVLHRERLNGRDKLQHKMPLADLPDGTMIAVGSEAFAIKGGTLLRWSFDGYCEALPRRKSELVEVLTPPSMVRALSSYAPLFHISVEQVALARPHSLS